MDNLKDIKEYFEPYFNNIMEKLKEIKDDIDKLYDRHNVNNDRITKLEIQVRIMWAVFGTIGGISLAYFIKQLLELL